VESGDFEEYLNDNGFWEDPDMGADETTMEWDIDPTSEVSDTSKIYKRHGEITDDKAAGKFYQTSSDHDYDTVVLWGDELSFKDVQQGSIGDCYFLAAILACAHWSEQKGETLLKRALPLSDFSSTGILPFTFFMSGHPTRFYVDDRLVMDGTESSYTYTFANLGDDGSAWVNLYEKAWAKANGNYNHISGGDVGEVVNAITGAPSQSMLKWTSGTRYSNNYFAEDDMWNSIVAAVDAGYIVSMGTDGGDDTTTNEYNLVQGHAYTLLDYFVSAEGVQFAMLKNPWKSEVYDHDLETKSEASVAGETNGWNTDTEEAVAAKGYTLEHKDDGIIYVKKDILFAGFGSYTVNYINLDWEMSVLEFTDTSDSGTTYTFDVTNPIEQDVFIVIDILNERNNPCIRSDSMVYSQAEIKWIRDRSTDSENYDWTYSTL
jgi:hypothetical protein